jgi:hypothetical protein
MQNNVFFSDVLKKEEKEGFVPPLTRGARGDLFVTTKKSNGITKRTDEYSKY